MKRNFLVVYWSYQNPEQFESKPHESPRDTMGWCDEHAIRLFLKIAIYDFESSNLRESNRSPAT